MPWRAIAEMLGCGDDPTVLERQQARLMWQQQQQCLSAANTTTTAYHDLEVPFSFPTPSQNSTSGGELDCEMPSPVFGGTCPFSGSPDMGGLSRTFSCPPIVRVDNFKENSNGSKKRIAGDNRRTEFDGNVDKKTKCQPDVATQLKPKREIEPSSGANEKKNTEISIGNSKGSTKVAETVPKTDYIHVRARRGQATDSHSLAERVRREKISERMKYLQDLVPGCNRITGKAGMLDEIINYVQSLQRQVEFLSMKLAAVNPAIDFNPDAVLTSKSIPACNTGLHTAMGIPNLLMDAPYIPEGSLVHPCGSSSCGPEMPMNPSVPALSRTMSAPVSFPADVFTSTGFDSLGAASAWDQSDFLCLNNGVQFHHGKQFFTGVLEANSIKMEM